MEVVIIDVSLGGGLGFRKPPIKSLSKLFYYPERYVQTDRTRYWPLIEKNCITSISTGKSFKGITFSTLYVNFDCFGYQ